MAAAPQLGNNFSTDPKVTKALQRFSNLLTSQRIWCNEWQELADYVLPRKNSILVQRVPGTKRTQKLYDSTMLDASELLAASMHGTLTSSHMRWFYLETDTAELNASQKVRMWLDQVSQKMNDAFNASNFHSEVQEYYTELVVFGTGALLFEEQKKKAGKFAGFQFSTVPIGKYSIGEGPNNLVNTFFRTYTLSNQAIMEKWPDTAPKEIRESQKPDDMKEIIYCIYPNVNASGYLSKKWTALHILMKSKTLLQEGGFYSFPLMVARWSKNSDEVYGRGPSHNAIPDGRSLNKIIELELRAVAKTVDPPMGNVSGDVIGAARLVPGGMTTVRNKESIFPILTGINFKISNLKKEELRASIKSIYKIDQLQLPQGGPQMTATETNVRYELMQRILGPTLGRLEIEFAKPLIDRAFDLLWRAGELPPMPYELQQASRTKSIQLRIKYEGPLARAQKASDVTAIQQLNVMLEPLIQANPQIADVIDWDEEIRMIAEVLGVPAKIVRDSKAVEILRQAKEQQMQQAQQSAQQSQGAQDASNAAPMVKALGTRPDPGSPLEKMQNGATGANRAAT